MKQHKFKPYIAQNVEMIRSPAFEDLSGYAVKLLLLMQIHWQQYMPIAYGISEAEKRLKCSRGTAWKAFRELVSHGFIVLVTESDFFKHHARKWRLTYREFNDNPPTNDWKEWNEEK